MGTNRTVRRSALLMAIALVGALGVLTATPNPAHAADAFTISRIAGGDRATTAAAIAGASFPAPAGAQIVLIARDDDFPDALAGNYSAGLLSAPLLLTGRTALPDITKTAIAGLGAKAAVVLGGTTAVAPSVVGELTALGLNVSRIGGDDRFATAAQLALAAGPDAVGRNEDALRTAILSSGLNFPDALAAGPLAYRQHFPQLLAGPGPLPASTRQALQDLHIQHVIITGGSGAVDATMESQLAQIGIGSVERIAGPTRYSTALGIVNKAVDAFDFNPAHLDFATGENFPDALADGPHGGRNLSPLVLVPPTTTGDDFGAVCNTLQFAAAVTTVGHALGGTTAISDAGLAALTACGRPTAPVTTSGQVVRFNPTASQYTFVEADETIRTVNFDFQDLYVIDGQTSTRNDFFAAVTPGDDITYDDDVSSLNRDVHRLTNRVITQGLVGNVNAGDANVLSILNPVTGDAIGGPYRWDVGGDAFTVDGTAGASLATFEGSLNEGDAVDVTLTADGPTAFALTNGALTGTITARSAADGSFATFDVDDVFGDEAENDQDAVFRAQATPPAGTAETYLTNGVPALDFATFNLTLSVGDRISVSRTVVAGVPTERFELTNQTPAPITGQVTSFANTAEDPTAADVSGDRIAIVPASGGYRNVDYTNTPLLGFRVDGTIVDEAAFEAALSPGDRLSFQPGSTSPAVTEVLSLTNAPLQGQLAFISAAIKIYGVYADDGATLLALVSYTAAGTPALVNRYFINGAERTLEQWEAEAPDVNVAPNDLDDTIAVEVAGGNRNHRLTTTDPITP